MKKNKDINFYFFVLFCFLFFAAFIFFISSIIGEIGTSNNFFTVNNLDKEIIVDFVLDDFQKFSSEEDYLHYLSRARDMQESYHKGFIDRRGGEIFIDEILEERMIVDMLESPLHSPDTSFSKDGASPDRYSETNIQVDGIDEPDIIKTDGINIYLSEKAPHYYYWHHSPQETKTKIIKSFPYEELKLLSEIDKGGELFLRDNILVIIQKDKIMGYNVEDVVTAEKIWEIKINDNTVISSARLKEETIYLVIQSSFSYDNPCMIRPLTFKEKDFTISCTDVYHPKVVIPADVTYTALKVDLKKGEKEDSISFVGSSNTSITYMSHNNLYLSYFKQPEIIEFITKFFHDDCTDIIDNSIIQRLQKLNSYDISSQSKMTEMEIIISNYFNSLTGDEQLKIENEITNRIGNYYEENRRKLESTGIVKINLQNFKIESIGNIPGNLLNQFALDEYQGKLRVATTVGERLSWIYNLPGGMATVKSINDVYVLDEDLKAIGVVRDLGSDEKIYAVRFLGDMGYVVTFREIDPFYILDLSNPFSPEMKGELKMPGYSSYLHPINKNRMLGIGMEDWNVKASLFDISDPYNPKEISNYKLSENWSEAVNNHHAFLIDKKHEIFFLPGTQGGYIFSYNLDKITLKKAIKQNNVQRALYIDEYLYIVGRNKITVLDQNSWEKVKELEF